MQRDPERYLYDILSSCEFLIEFTRERTLKDYAADRGFRSAVERELQIIGEALMQLNRVNPTLAGKISECKNIIGFRHVLVHGYASLEPATVWGIIEEKLEILRDEVKSLLGDEPSP